MDYLDLDSRGLGFGAMCLPALGILASFLDGGFFVVVTYTFFGAYAALSVFTAWAESLLMRTKEEK